MNRNQFLKVSGTFVMGSTLGLNQLSAFNTECNPIFWNLLKKFGEALLIDLAVDYAKPIIKSLFSSNDHQDLQRQGYRMYNEVPIYSYPSSSFSSNSSSDSGHSYTMIQQTKKGDIIGSQTPFIVNKQQRVDTAVIFRESELAALVQITEKLLEFYTEQDVREIILPNKVSSRTWLNHGDKSSGAVVFYTNNGKVEISYTKPSLSQINAGINIFPNREEAGSQDILKKSISDNFKILI
jgi:hypothetical protein